MEGAGPGKELKIVNQCIRQTIAKYSMSVGGSVVIPLRPKDMLLGRVVALLWIIKTKVHELFEGYLLICPGKNHFRLPKTIGNN